MGEDVGGVVHELGAAFAEAGHVIHKPAGEQGGEHAFGRGVARFASPDVEVPAVDEGLVFGGARIEVVHVRGDRVALGVDARDAADDAVAHDGAHVGGVEAGRADLGAAIGHALNGEGQVFVDVHVDPAGMRVGERGRVGAAGDATHLVVVHGDFHALGAGVETKVIVGHGASVRSRVSMGEQTAGCKPRLGRKV